MKTKLSNKTATADELLPCVEKLTEVKFAKLESAAEATIDAGDPEGEKKKDCCAT